MGQFIDFNYVKKHANFETILKHYNVDLIGSGDERRCLCPFHDDTDPSMTVNLEKNVFHCHAASCGEKGNVLEFVDGYEGQGLRHAAAAIGEICNIALAEPKPGQSKRKAGKPAAKSAGRKPAKKASKPKADKPPVAKTKNEPLPFQLTLDPDHEYGRSRSLSPPVITRFGMGYCSKGVMAGRWCIPIRNINDEIVAYIGRYAAADVPKDVEKYRLPSGFRKDLELFNLNNAGGISSDVVVLVEASFDAIRLDELGIPAAALLGTSLSDAQFALLKQAGFSSVIVLLDAGAKKAERKLVHQLSRGFFVRSVALPDDEDPATVSEDFLQERVCPLIA